MQMANNFRMKVVENKRKTFKTQNEPFTDASFRIWHRHNQP